MQRSNATCRRNRAPAQVEFVLAAIAAIRSSPVHHLALELRTGCEGRGSNWPLTEMVDRPLGSGRLLNNIFINRCEQRHRRFSPH